MDFELKKTDFITKKCPSNVDKKVLHGIYHGRKKLNRRKLITVPTVLLIFFVSFSFFYVGSDTKLTQEEKQEVDKLIVMFKESIDEVLSVK